MELSWSYTDTIYRMVSTSAYRSLQVVQGNYSPISLTFDVNLHRSGCDIPVFCINKALDWFVSNDQKNFKAVIPLGVDYHGRQCAGAETMLKYFTRFYNYNCRLGKVSTPKGEVYYGANGIILDKDFNPLMVTTVRVEPETGEGSHVNYYYRGITVHLSPKVFTDDVSVLNKHLAKKGMFCFLSHNFTSLGNTGPVKVEIEDCSKFFQKAVKPDVQKDTEEDIQKILQDNIDEVLGQFTLDYSING